MQHAFSVMLTKEEIEQLAGRYHFTDADLFQIQGIYKEVERILAPTLYYRVFTKENGLCFINYDTYAVCVVTLGKEIDELQYHYSMKERIADAYIVECLGMELLSKAYQYVAEILWQETGLWAGKYDFLGEQFSLEWMQEIFDSLLQREVTYNKAYMLTPKKSVVYITQLTKKRQSSSCHICSNCTNVTCQNRIVEEQGEKDKDTASEKHINYSYGYQRIFGKHMPGNGGKHEQ